MNFRKGQTVTFQPKRGEAKQAVVVEPRSVEGRVAVRIASDPFPVLVEKSQLSTCEEFGNDLKSKKKVQIGSKVKKGPTNDMATKTENKPSARELRDEAKGLGVKNYEDLGRKDLIKAIKAKKAKAAGKSKTKGSKSKVEKVSREEAVDHAEKRAKSKKSAPKSAAKAASKKAPAKKAVSKPKADGDNPFRPGSNLAIILPLLLKGGKRETLAQKLSEKVALHPYTGDPDAVSLLDYDKRIILASGTLRDKFGFTVERDGRGLNGTIKVFAPGDKPAAAKKGKKKAKK